MQPVVSCPSLTLTDDLSPGPPRGTQAPSNRRSGRPLPDLAAAACLGRPGKPHSSSKSCETRGADNQDTGVEGPSSRATHSYGGLRGALRGLRAWAGIHITREAPEATKVSSLVPLCARSAPLFRGSLSTIHKVSACASQLWPAPAPASSSKPSSSGQLPPPPPPSGPPAGCPSVPVARPANIYQQHTQETRFTHPCRCHTFSDRVWSSSQAGFPPGRSRSGPNNKLSAPPPPPPPPFSQPDTPTASLPTLDAAHILDTASYSNPP